MANPTRKGNKHSVRIGDSIIDELAERGDVSVDRAGRVYGFESYLKRTLKRRD